MPIRIARALSLGYGLCLVIGAVLPNPDAPGLPEMSDVWLHALGYGMLGGLLVFSQGKERRLRHRALRAFGGVLVLGLTTEILQVAVPYRHFQLGDLLADGIGGAVVVSLSTLIVSAVETRRREPV